MDNETTWDVAVARRQELMRERDRLTSEVLAIDREMSLLDLNMMGALIAARAALPAEAGLLPEGAPTQPERKLFSSPSEYFLWLFQLPGELDLETAAAECYGANTPQNRRRVSHEIGNLKVAGKIRDAGPNRYEVVK